MLTQPRLCTFRPVGSGLASSTAVCRTIYVPLDTAAEGDPVQWTLARLRTRLPAMLIQANEPALAREFDQRDIDAALPKIAGWAEALQAQARHQG